jgi:hypothetical protein
MIDSIVNRGIEDQFGLHVQLNAPEFFEREDFIRYIETQTVFSWHQAGSCPTEWSDVAVLVEPNLQGEGDSSDMPEDLWDTILGALRAKFGEDGEGIPHFARNRHIVVRLTNMEAVEPEDTEDQDEVRGYRPPILTALANKFIQAFKAANAIEVDGYFARNFHGEIADYSDGDPETLVADFSIETVHGDMGVMISLDELSRIEVNLEDDKWYVAGREICLYSVTKSPLNPTTEDLRNQVEVFTVEHDGEHYQSVFPSELADNSASHRTYAEAARHLIMVRDLFPSRLRWGFEDPKAIAKALWKDLSTVPVHHDGTLDDECLVEDWLIFAAGTHREEVWHWFEDYFDVSVADDLMNL